MTIKYVKRRLEETYDILGYYDPDEIRDMVRKIRSEEDGVTMWDVVSAMLTVVRENR